MQRAIIKIQEKNPTCYLTKVPDLPLELSELQATVGWEDILEKTAQGIFPLGISY